MQAWRLPELNQGNPDEKREEIRQYFHATYDQYEHLFTCLKSDDGFLQRPEPLRHPLIFYYGHTAVFFVNKLRVAGIIDHRLNEAFESMLAIGVDEMSWDDLDEKNYDWPDAESVRAYRKKVRHLVDQLIDDLPLQCPLDWHSPFWIILMGIEHERIHLETSSVLLRQLDCDQLQALPDWPVCKDDPAAPENSLLPVVGQAIRLGRESDNHDYYGWDNEYGTLETEVPDFSASQYLVSNQEFLAFVEDGGYENAQWWTEEGWNWREFKQAQHPVFWIKTEGDYRYRALFDEMDMPWSWPVDVNYLEAKAFCNWLSARKGRSIRLPTEAEYEVLRASHFPQDIGDWVQAPSANINLEHWASACPVNAFQQGDFYDVVGNVWQWTESHFDAYPGFKVHPAYDDFSVPTFDGRHNLIKGGAWVSTGNEALRTARYAFRRHFYQHAGFRYVESEHNVDSQFNPYETDNLIAQYLEFHYGANYFGVANFPKTCVDTLMTQLSDMPKTKALDIGCAVGRSSFELAQYFDQVDALDFSTRFIQNALRLRNYGEIRFLLPTEGELAHLKTVKLADLGLEGNFQHIDFSQGDACNLKVKYQGYDLIFAGNLIDRLYEPARFLQDMRWRLKPGGLLVLTSPYTWLEAFTDRNQWLGGYRDQDGENVTTLQGIAQALGESFKVFADPVDIPFVIRETARKHQHTLAQMSFWQKCDSQN